MNFTHPILVVEDDDLLREQVGLALKRRGYTVHAADSGQKAIDVLEPLRTSCVLLVDLMMPQVDGWELIGKIREHGERHQLQHHVVVISGALAARDIAHQEGAAYLPKPFSLSELLLLLQAYQGV